MTSECGDLPNINVMIKVVASSRPAPAEIPRHIVTSMLPVKRDNIKSLQTRCFIDVVP